LTWYLSAVAALNRFALGLGLLTGPVPYEQVVPTRFRLLWYGGAERHTIDRFIAGVGLK
jgi:hypothetical protein